MLSLAYLPVVPTAGALQFLAETAYLIGNRYVCRRSSQELAYPPNREGRGFRPHERTL